MNVFIASDEMVSATHLQIRITLPTNVFVASDECVLCWGRALLTLEANVFCVGDEQLVLETNILKTRVRVSATHTQLATSNFHAEFMLR